jgi:hypothetical protein
MNDALEQGTKHPGGRPLKFATPEELLDRAQEYFDTVSQKEWTITGLALYLDTSRETLMNYQHKGEFFDAVKKVKDMIEHAYEIRGMEKGGVFDIFRLKNMGWKDRTETDITTDDQPLSALQVPQEKVQEFASFLAQDMKKQG